MILQQFRPFHGPMRYVFKDPDTGFEYRELTEAELVKRIVNYRAQNGLAPILHLDIVLQNYWCSLPENLGACQPRKQLQRGLLAYLKGGIALLDNLWYGEKSRATQEEADRRSKICAGCKYNVDPDKGKFAAWADSMAEYSVGNAKSKYHDKLFNCEVCSCSLRAKVWWNGDMGLTEENKEKMLHVGCWQPDK